MNKKEKVQFVIETLQKTYPKIPIPLDHKDPYTLLVAVLLSAQCTDVRVNKITPLLFSKADNPFDMIKLTVEEIKNIIGKTNKRFTEVYYDIRYSGYVNKQQRELAKMKNLEEHHLGLIFDYSEVVGLSGELVENLNAKKPKNLYDASLMEGITPAVLNVLTIHLKKINAIRSNKKT